MLCFEFGTHYEVLGEFLGMYLAKGFKLHIK